jgi:hypothetical protein
MRQWVLPRGTKAHMLVGDIMWWLKHRSYFSLVVFFTTMSLLRFIATLWTIQYLIAGVASGKATLSFVFGRCVLLASSHVFAAMARCCTPLAP